MSQSNEVLVPAGFGARLVAKIIDSLILAIPTKLISISVVSPSAATLDLTQMGTGYLFSTLVTGFYAGYCYSQLGATLGKKVLKIKVLDVNNGEKISFWRGFFRDTVGQWVSVLTLFIGYLWVFFDKRNRALHDIIFDTLVVKVTETAAFAHDNINGPAPVETPSEDPFRG